MDKYFFIIILVFFCQICTANISDPTRPPSTAISDLKDKKHHEKNQDALTAIFIKKGIKQAIINNHLYKKGDYYKGKIIISIQKNKVVLKSDVKRSELFLIKPIKKQINKKK